jgi:RNA polymerase sigma-70 factor (ECF subfamily)
VAAEVWLAVARGLSAFEGDEGNFRAWVFTVARRRSIDVARRRRRQPALAALDEVDVADPTATSSALVDAALALEAALKLLHRLTADQREVVALRVIVGMSVAETAVVVNKSEGAVRALCHRGLRTLAELLDTQPLDVGVPA